MNYILKRILDICMALFLLLLLLPVLIIIAICIKIDSPGKVVFKQKRLTKNGRVFYMYKFRSMVENAANMGSGHFSYDNDFRITRVGKFLRESSLDELLQLFNILKGDMSLVGPRPPLEFSLGDYNKLNATYKKRFEVLAGITGLAQISGRNALEWSERIKYDNLYVDKFNCYGVLYDFKILVLTFFSILPGGKKENIYETKPTELEGLDEVQIAAIMSAKVRAQAQKSEGENNE